MNKTKNNEKCSHKNWSLAGYPEERLLPLEKQSLFRVSSLYEVYCKDCNNFVDLFTGEIINNKGLIKINKF